jgi:hypothetical protein
MALEAGEDVHGEGAGQELRPGAVGGGALRPAGPLAVRGSRFFNVEGNGAVFDRMTAQELDRDAGPVLRLRRYGAPPVPLEKFGLVDDGPCETFRSGGRGRLSPCQLDRVTR